MAGTIMIITEKPKVAEKIAHFLGDNARKKYESKVPYYEVEIGGKMAIIASAVGHIYSLREKGGARGKIPVFDIEWVPAYMGERGASHTRDYIRAIERLAKNADEFVSACDYDIEGSLIGFNAIRFAAKSKTGKRMKFSALTEKDIVYAFEHMGELDYNNAYAGETRHILDWFWGINLSRALMGSIRKAGMYKVMSIGRVQGPALDVLVKREREISGFKPEPYWQLFVEKDKIKYIHEIEKFENEEKAEKALKNTSKSGKVESVAKSEIKVQPPPPFDLTTLQVEAYRAFKMSPKEVLQLAQNLYEGSYISYPRTSSQKLPHSLGLKAIIGKIGKIGEYAKEAGFLLENGLTKPHEGQKSDPAHPAIHPTGVYGKMGEREKKLYDLIVRRFLACFGEWAHKESAKAVLLMGKEKYIGKGIVTTKKGWTWIYGKYYKPDDLMLPELKAGDAFTADKLLKEDKMTQPPKRYTQTSLVKVLEKKKLGTKTTRATIVETLYKRDYVDAKSIEVTKFGMAVHDILKKYCPEILDEKLTKSFEEKVEMIQEGKGDKEKVIGEAKDVLTRIIREFGANENKIGGELLQSFRKSEDRRKFIMECGKCGASLVVKNTRDKRIFIGCSAYPKCTNAYPIPAEVKKVDFVRKCEKCSGPVIRYVIRKRRVEKCANRNCV